MVNFGGATEHDRKKIVITKDSKAFFHNNVDYCVGTGRMGLALTEEYQEELRLVQKEIGKRKSDLSISGDMDYSVMIWQSFRPMRRIVR